MSNRYNAFSVYACYEHMCHCDQVNDHRQTAEYPVIINDHFRGTGKAISQVCVCLSVYI